MLQYNGHIGYGIRPTERRKGYNKINLYLAMIEAKKLGLEKVMLGCNVNNIGSDRTLKSLGGTLEKTELDSSDGALTNVYWFDVEDTINIYEPSLYNDNLKNKKCDCAIIKKFIVYIALIIIENENISKQYK